MRAAPLARRTVTTLVVNAAASCGMSACSSPTEIARYPAMTPGKDRASIAVRRDESTVAVIVGFRCPTSCAKNKHGVNICLRVNGPHQSQRLRITQAVVRSRIMIDSQRPPESYDGLSPFTFEFALCRKNWQISEVRFRGRSTRNCNVTETYDNRPRRDHSIVWFVHNTSRLVRSCHRRSVHRCSELYVRCENGSPRDCRHPK